MQDLSEAVIHHYPTKSHVQGLRKDIKKKLSDFFFTQKDETWKKRCLAVLKDSPDEGLDRLLTAVAADFFDNKITHTAQISFTLVMDDKKNIKEIRPSLHLTYDYSKWNFVSGVESSHVNKEVKTVSLNTTEIAPVMPVNEQAGRYLDNQIEVESLHLNKKVKTENNKDTIRKEPVMYISNKYQEKQCYYLPRDEKKHQDQHLNNQIAKNQQAFKLNFLPSNAIEAISELSMPTSVVFEETKQGTQIKLMFQTMRNKLLSSTDQLFFIMAGRAQDDIALPQLSEHTQTRCVLIITHDELQRWDERRTHLLLTAGYELLIIHAFALPGNPEPRLDAVTIRRRVAVYLACVLELKHMIMSDDNLSTFYCPPQQNPNGLDTLFAFMQQQQQDRLIISIPSTRYIPHSQEWLDNALGSKLFMLAIQSFLTTSQLANNDWQNAMALFPLNEEYWGEDYFMQLFMDNLPDAFNDSTAHRYAIIDPQLAQIERRSVKHPHLCVKNGIRASTLKPAPKEFLTLLSNSMQAVHSDTTEQFNKLVEQQIVLHTHKFQYQKELMFFSNEQGDTRYSNVKALSTSSHDELFNGSNLLEQFSMQAHAYQRQALEHFALHSDTEPRVPFVFDIPTGCGKTLIMALLAFQLFLTHQKKHVIVVCPNIALVTQTRDRFINSYCTQLTNEKHANYIKERILPISSEYSHIISRAFSTTESLVNGAYIFIICQPSLALLCKGNRKLIANTSALIFDESHMVFSPQQMSDYFSDKLTLLFSATPDYSATPACIPFRHTRQQAIQEGSLVPFVLDKSVQCALSATQIIQLLKHHRHPDGNTPLTQHKIIIFMPNINSADDLFNQLREDADLRNNLYNIHSQNNDYSSDLKQFAENPHGIAIAVQMLKMGFDNERIDCVIINKKITDQASETQMIGRALRKTNAHPHKKKALIIVPTDMQPCGDSARDSLHVSSPYQTIYQTLTKLNAPQKTDKQDIITLKIPRF